jgi:hypothetical protein
MGHFIKWVIEHLINRYIHEHPELRLPIVILALIVLVPMLVYRICMGLPESIKLLKKRRQEAPEVDQEVFESFWRTPGGFLGL